MVITLLNFKSRSLNSENPVKEQLALEKCPLLCSSHSDSIHCECFVSIMRYGIINETVGRRRDEMRYGHLISDFFSYSPCRPIKRIESVKNEPIHIDSFNPCLSDLILFTVENLPTQTQPDPNRT